MSTATFTGSTATFTGLPFVRRARGGQRRGQVALWMLGGIVSLFCAGAGVWKSPTGSFEATAVADLERNLEVSYDDFRTAMVRNSPTKAIIEHGGMELLEDEMVDMDIDLSKDRRPLLNALLGRSQSEVKARKRIVVALNAADLRLERLALMQDVRISPEGMLVETYAQQPGGELKSYRARLQAKPVGEHTQVKLQVEIGICKQLNGLFHGPAKARLDAAAEEAIEQQFVALEKFLAEVCP